MFEVGRKYEFHTLELDERGYWRSTSTGTVTRIDGTLIEVDADEIINTAAPTFEGAIDVEGRSSRAAEAGPVVILGDE